MQEQAGLREESCVQLLSVCLFLVQPRVLRVAAVAACGVFVLSPPRQVGCSSYTCATGQSRLLCLVCEMVVGACWEACSQLYTYIPV